jgi:hypothetical protein
MAQDKKRQQHVIKMETQVTLGVAKPEIHLEKRRSAIKAALHAATASLAATTSSLAAQAIRLDDGDGGTPPWGEVIIEPIWYESNPQFGDILRESAQVKFWE